ncbi:MAG: hypothetical protein MRY83_10105, partial [Flavobacteriales bacterium]|nr:hypothetical protein [Flavobacteriales bacterium]
EILLSSVMYKLDALKKLIKALVDKGKLNQGTINNLFDNYFNEPVHKASNKQLDSVKVLMLRLLSQKMSVNGEEINRQENLYSILRVLNFITKKTKVNEPVS